MFDQTKILKSEKMVCKLSDKDGRLYEPSRIRSETGLANRPSVKIPEPHIYPFASSCQTDNIFTLNKNFVKYWEKQEEELNEQVEYDLDDEDLNWLDEVNQERNEKGGQPIKQADLAQMMDRLEKESFFQSSSTNDPKHQANPADPNDTNEDALCSVCLDGECLANNVILFCDMCNLAVHQECYGVPYVPEGQWLCRRCLQSPSAPVSCVLCHSKNGAFKQTDKGEWVHMVCAIWVPEVHFANTIFLEPVMGIECIDKQRWRLLCYICRKRGGACIQCDKSNCYTAFHVTCAQQAGLYMKIREEVVGQQRVQNQKNRKKSNASRHRRKADDSEEDTDKSIDTINSNNLSSESPNSSAEKEVRKCAYCDLHTPIEVLSPEIRKKLERKKISAACRDEFLKKAQKARMEKARRILAEKQNRPPIINLPAIPQDRIQSIAELIEIDDKDQFLGRLIGYWKMKRFSRNGVPLVRRLQRSAIKLSSDNASSERSVTSNELDQFFMLRKLRNDLERARLLIEMVKKREKIKREERLVEQMITLHQTRPFYVLLSLTLEQLVALDQKRIFTQPVNAAEAPGYYETIKNPMDFLTMREKINNMRYENLNKFEDDLKLIVENCFAYNAKGDPYYNAGVKLKSQSVPIMKHAHQQYALLLNDCKIDQPTSLRSSQDCNVLVSSLDNLAFIENTLKQMASSAAGIKMNAPATPSTASKELKEITTSCLNSPVIGTPSSLLKKKSTRRSGL